MMESLDKILPRVAKPVRYTGGEWGAISKDLDSVNVRFALAFPDVYDIGMSNLGLRILYHVLNEQDDVYAERVFAPWPDMEEEMRSANLPLFSLETFTPLSDFDVIGFSLSYELTYTNVLNMLDLAGIPIRASDRNDDHPLIIAGGHCTFNPESMAEYIDAFAIGEGEDVILEIVDSYKRGRGNRAVLLQELAKIPGVYIPSFYKSDYDEQGNFVATVPVKDGVPSQIRKRIVDDFDTAPFPEKMVVPFLETVHERTNLEIMRGCTRACRFCQAGMITRPLREKSVDTLMAQAEELITSTGHDEIALTSLSSADYTDIGDLLHKLVDEYEPRRIGVSLPSLRADAKCVMLAADIERVRKTGLTFAPEAGTQRLRDAINKNVTLEDLLGAVEAAVRSGWRKIKLYFMIGLPTETDEDVLGIADVVKAVLRRAKECGRPISVNVGVSSFIPKPHTPFQWRAHNDLPEIERKFDLLKDALRIRGVDLSWHEPKTSQIESVLTRGDRRVGDAIYQAWKLGAKFDGWHEYFDFDRWLKAFDLAGIDPSHYANRLIEHEEPLPWDHIDCGVTKRYLAVQDRLAEQAKVVEDCRDGVCTNCGITTLLPPGMEDCWQEINERKDGQEPFANKNIESATSERDKKKSQSTQPRFRVLITFSKGENVKWLGHLDLLRTFKRAINRAKLPLLYSEGFNPRPKMSFASALGVGVTGGRELLMLELAEEVEPTQIARKLSTSLPRGIKIMEVQLLPQSAPKSIQVAASEFEVTVSGVSGQNLQEAVTGLLARTDIIIDRKKDGRTTPVNIGTEIISLNVVISDDLIIIMQFNHGRITPKPSEVVDALRVDLPEIELVRVHRVRLLNILESENKQ